MYAGPIASRRRFSLWTFWAAVCCAGLLGVGQGRAEEGPPVLPPISPPPVSTTAPAVKPAVHTASPTAPEWIQQAGCASCSSGMLGPHFGSGGCGAHCYPGRRCDHECGSHQDNHIARIWNGFYECLCCPDPCYEPRWVAAANSAFFADQVRPITQMRLRWDAVRNGFFSDRAEVIHARADGRGKGPRAPVSSRFDMDEFAYYMEGATGRFGLFVEIPYRNLDREGLPVEAGFMDMNIGTKSLLLDCELMQITFQFRTFIPTGSPGKGLSTGHVTLEPSLLSALKLGPNTYLQCQAAYMIPIGGDQDYAGDVFHYHLSFNHVLWRPLTGVQIVGTAEFNGWSVLDGQFTLPTAAGAVPFDARGSLLSAGPGVRVVICDKIDFGVGSAFAITSDKWAEQMYRAEFRWRF